MTRRNADHPEADPSVQALGGFDVTAMTVAELGDAGIKLVAITEEDREALGDPWRSHSEYLALVPETDAIERGYARLAAFNHLAVQARTVACPTCTKKAGHTCLGGRPHAERLEAARVTIKGLRLARSFPCLGTFRVREVLKNRKGEDTTMVFMCCDQCGADLGVANPDMGKRWAQDDIPL